MVKAAAVPRKWTENVHQVWNAMKIFIAFLIGVSSLHDRFHLFFSGLFRFSLSASCLHTMHFDDLVSWKPNCEIDGSYASKSCRGDKLTGRCFCVGETGERIFGWDWWRNADDMTCSCSRQRHRAEMSGRLDVTLHCLPNGGFEELQCDMEICWCADESDGHILKGTMAVPKALWTYLPCCERHKNEM